MASPEERFITGILDGNSLGEAARLAGMEESSARRLLERLVALARDLTADDPRDGRTRGSAPAEGGPESLLLSTDGASLGNPGHAGAGGVISTPGGDVVEEFCEYIGTATSNVAEYEAIRIGLTKALAHGAKRVTVRLDSELVANQLTGRYRVKNRKLLELYFVVQELISRFEHVEFARIPRKENERADRLAGMGARSGT